MRLDILLVIIAPFICPWRGHAGARALIWSIKTWSKI
jgi:hypothetical protein